VWIATLRVSRYDVALSPAHDRCCQLNLTDPQVAESLPAGQDSGELGADRGDVR
jgi:hypothetical protein